MKVIMYMAITANGMIARKNDDSDFLSGDEWKEYLKNVKKAGNVIVGRRTFEVCAYKQRNFPFPHALNVVITKHKIKNRWGNKVIFTADSPKKIISMLKDKGFKLAFLGGGSITNSYFIKANLVDEIYLDVVPTIIGEGFHLFAEESFDKRLKLLGIKKFPAGFVQLHYRIVK